MIKVEHDWVPDSNVATGNDTWIQCITNYGNSSLPFKPIVTKLLEKHQEGSLLEHNLMGFIVDILQQKPNKNHSSHLWK